MQMISSLYPTNEKTLSHRENTAKCQPIFTYHCIVKKSKLECLGRFFTARKRSLGQGNVFYTCLSVILFTVATEAGATHPTGMHTCYIFCLQFSKLLFNKCISNRLIVRCTLENLIDADIDSCCGYH